jgi:hypothetical protein
MANDLYVQNPAVALQPAVFLTHCWKASSVIPTSSFILLQVVITVMSGGRPEVPDDRDLPPETGSSTGRWAECSGRSPAAAARIHAGAAAC